MLLLEDVWVDFAVNQQRLQLDALHVIQRDSVQDVDLSTTCWDGKTQYVVCLCT